MRPAQKVLTAVSILTLAGSMTACSAPTNQSSGNSFTGDNSKELVIACSQQEDFCQKMTKAFSEKSGIKARYVRLGAGEVLARLQATKGEFDVWSGGQAENHLIAADKGFIENYVSPNAKDLKESQADPKGSWAGFYTDSISFCYNKDELDRLGAKVPQSWQDLLQPQLKGRIVMAHPATAGVGYMVMWTALQVNGGKDQGFSYLEKLNKNILQYSKSSATSTEMAGRGEIAVGIALDSDCAKAYGAGYDKLAYSYPSEGTGYEIGAVSVLSGAKNKDVAKKYMDWILSKEAQDLFGDVPSFAAPVRSDAKLGKNVPPQDKIKQVEWDYAKAAASRAELLEVFNKQIASEGSAK